MIEILQATALANRFENQPYWRLLTDGAIEELARAFQSAETIEQAVAAAEWLLQYGEEQITTQQIHARLRETPFEPRVKRDQSCRHCAGTGLRDVFLIPNEGRMTKDGRRYRRLLCDQCAGSCEARPGVERKMLCWDAAAAIGAYTSAEPCPECEYGRGRALAYHQAAAEQQAKREAKRT